MNQRESELAEAIEHLKDQRNLVRLTDEQQTQLVSAKEDLVGLRLEKIKGIVLRSIATWVDEGEKPTQFFLNLSTEIVLTKQFQSLFEKMVHL